MQFASLGSGSKGNGTLIKTNSAVLLIDCGFSLKQTEARLQRLQQDPNKIDAILLTHEHSDHIAGVSKLAKKYQLKIWGSSGTLIAKSLIGVNCQTVNIHQKFTIKDCTITPVAVPHDAQEPCQYVISNLQHKLGILTDVGHITPHIVSQFQSCDAMLLETNYDETSLANGPYPPALKHRVGGKLGHLSNTQAAEFLSKIYHNNLRQLVLMHISQNNNNPQLARTAITKILPATHKTKILIANQDLGFTWLKVG